MAFPQLRPSAPKKFLSGIFRLPSKHHPLALFATDVLNETKPFAPTTALSYVYSKNQKRNGN